MKTAGHLAATLLVALFMAPATQAETRVWTDTQGQTIDAEFVRMEVETVVLRKQDGREIRVALDALSENDRRYALLQVPPRIEMKVAMGVDQKNVGYLGDRENSYRLQYQIVHPSVTLRKASTSPYEAPLVLAMVVMGKIQETDRFVVLDHAIESFTFSSGNEYTYYGDPIDLEQIKGSLRAGIEYDGYIVAVSDHSDAVVALKASRTDLQQHAAEILKASIGALFNEDLRPISPKTPAVRSNRSLPGRMF